MSAFALGGIGAQTVPGGGGDVARFQVVIRLKSSGETVIDRSVDADDRSITRNPDTDPNARTMEIRFPIPEGGDAETFTLLINAFNAAGARIFEMGPVDFTLSSGSVTVQPTYVGPGRDVTGVSLSPRSVTVGVNETVPVSCVGTPGNVTDFPFELLIVNTGVATVQSNGVRGVAAGATELVCRLGFGTRAEDRIPVTVTAGGGSPSLAVQSGGGQTGAAGTTLANSITVIARNADGTPAPGIVVQFTPFAANGSVNPTSATTNASGLASTLWTVGQAPGTQRLLATATIQGSQVQVEVTATVTAPVATGSLTGNIRDAATDSPVISATVTIRQGTDVTTGPAFAPPSQVSGTGLFTFANIPVGPYTIQVTAPGYNPEIRNTTVEANAIRQVVIPMRSTANQPAIQIQLEWGALPEDLDAYLYLPGQPTTPVFFGNTRSCGIDPACLRNDATNGFGPELVDITVQQAGTYFFHVHNFSGACNGISTPEMRQSGAVVRVYFNGVLQQTFNVPNQPGTHWRVFQLNGTTITPVNTIATDQPVGGGCGFAPAGQGAEKVGSR